jgi:hypothetical protein
MNPIPLLGEVPSQPEGWMVCSQRGEVQQPVAAMLAAPQAVECHLLRVTALPSEVVVLRLQRQPTQPEEAYPVLPGTYRRAGPGLPNYHRARLDYPLD